jgi:hypothetical protein
MGGPAKFTDVRHPEKVQVMLHDAIEENATGISANAGETIRRPSPVPPEPVAPPAGDITLQLERLEGLLQRGSITQAEYDAQKARLLGS